MTATKPGVRPAIPHFSSGPCAKRPGWSLQALTDAVLGRSHRSKIGKAKLKRSIDLTREILEVPADYRIGIVPASDTGAVEMALWSLLGARPVTMLTWESFGEGWVTDVEKQLKLKDVTVLKAPYGELPDLSKVDFNTDVVFTWNGTTSGVRVPNGDPVAVRHPHAGSGAVPGEHHVGVEVDFAQVGQLAIGRFQHRDIFELELFLDVGHPAFAEGFPGQHGHGLSAQQRPQRHLDRPGIGGRHDADAIIGRNFQHVAGEVDGAFELRLADLGSVRAS